MDPTITAGWIGAVGGILGGAVGGGIAYLAAVKSLTAAAAQAAATQEAEWAEARGGALLALVWELEVNQGLLEILATDPKQTPPVLAHQAMNGASAWLGSLPDTVQVAVHDAQVALSHYNAAVGRLLNYIAIPRPDDWKDFRRDPQETAMARGKVRVLVPPTVERLPLPVPNWAGYWNRQTHRPTDSVGAFTEPVPAGPRVAPEVRPRPGGGGTLRR